MDGSVHVFSGADLTAIAAAYDPAKHEAPIVIGHPKTDAPAYGWVKAAQFADGVLTVAPDQVEPQFAEMVKAGRFKKRSAAFFGPHAPGNPTPGKYYLRHVGFLGAQPPAVKGLRDVSFNEREEGVVVFADWNMRSVASILRRIRDFFISKYSLEEVDQVMPSYLIEDLEAVGRGNEAAVAYAEMDAAAAIESLKAAIARHKRHLDGTEATDAESQKKMMAEMMEALRALGVDTKTIEMSDPQETEMNAQEREAQIKADREAIERKMAEFAEREKAMKAAAEAATRRTAIAEFVGALVRAGKILPREQAGLVAYMVGPNESGVIEFAEGAERKTTAPEVWLKQFLEALPQRVEFSELTRPEADRGAFAAFAAPAGYSVDPVRLELHNQALAYQRAHPNTSYDAALAAVSH